jgi:hypothetical protein
MVVAAAVASSLQSLAGMFVENASEQGSGSLIVLERVL